MRNKGNAAVCVLTVGGEIQLVRRYFWSKQSGGICPPDAAMGIDTDRVSPGAREICCTMGVAQDFAQGAQDLHRMCGLRVSKERLRQITEREGARIVRLQENAGLTPSWSGGDAHTSTPTAQNTTRVYVGADGVGVRMGHRIGTDRGHVQESHPETETNGDEVGCRERRRDQESDRPAEKRIVASLLGHPKGRLMPESVATLIEALLGPG